MRVPTSMHLVPLTLIAALAVGAAAPVLAGGDAAAGARAWTEEHAATEAPTPRSCASCHTADLTKVGKLASTGKPIDPMAVSVNPKRLTDPAKIEKWFRRNCHWTLGRACTPQEKDDFLAYIRSR